MTDTTAISSTVAAHVLHHLSGHTGGYPAGSFTGRLLELWSYADNVNSARLAAGWPEYGAAIALLDHGPAGIQQLRAIVDGAHT